MNVKVSKTSASAVSRLLHRELPATARAVTVSSDGGNVVVSPRSGTKSSDAQILYRVRDVLNRHWYEFSAKNWSLVVTGRITG